MPDLNRLRQSIANLTGRLPQDQFSERTKTYLQEGSHVDEIVDEVLNWLSQPLNSQWLLIFDNVDREFLASSGDPEAFNVEKYFPKADQGSILITSRLANLWRLGTDLKLGPVDETQGENILENSLGKSIEDSSKLVRLLQGLPLAINQAGSFMRETGTNLAEYMRLYEKAWRRLMTLRDDANCSVLTTWTLSFDRLWAESKAAANLLLLWAFLDNQDLWYELLAPALNQKIFGDMPDWFAKCAGNELDFKECMGLLLKYSFIDAKPESSSFSTHSVFHHWCFHAFEEKRAVMSGLALMVVASAVPSESVPHYLLKQRRLLPHCDRVFSLMQQRMQEMLMDEVDLQRQSSAYHELGALCLRHGKMNDAEVMYLRALAGYEKAWGAEHTSTLDTVNNLGVLYSGQGKMKDAEVMYLRALAGKEKAWGAEHTSTLDTVNNLGGLYRDQGKMKDAEVMYLRALAGKEKAWGAEHKHSLSTRYDMAILCHKMHRYKDAIEQLELVVHGFTKVLGADHHKTVNASQLLDSYKAT